MRAPSTRPHALSEGHLARSRNISRGTTLRIHMNEVCKTQLAIKTGNFARDCWSRETENRGESGINLGRDGANTR